MTAFVTGSAGFAGRHLLALLGPDVIAPPREELDLLDPAAVRGAIAGAEPALVLHLAALASVGRSWDDPRAALTENIAMSLNLLEAVRLLTGHGVSAMRLADGMLEWRLADLHVAS